MNPICGTVIGILTLVLGVPFEFAQLLEPLPISTVLQGLITSVFTLVANLLGCTV